MQPPLAEPLQGLRPLTEPLQGLRPLHEPHPFGWPGCIGPFGWPRCRSYIGMPNPGAGGDGGCNPPYRSDGQGI